MTKLTDLAAAVGRVLAPIGFAVTIDVTDNAETVTTQSPVAPSGAARVDYITLIRRLSHAMASAPDGHYLRVTVPDANDWQFSVVPGGAVLTGAGPEYHGTTTNEADETVPKIDLSHSVPRLTMQRLSPGGWCERTTEGVFCYGKGIADFIEEGGREWVGAPLWVEPDMPWSSDRRIDGLGPRTKGITVYGIFAA